MNVQPLLFSALAATPHSTAMRAFRAAETERTRAAADMAGAPTFEGAAESSKSTIPTPTDSVEISPEAQALLAEEETRDPAAVSETAASQSASGRPAAETEEKPSAAKPSNEGEAEGADGLSEEERAQVEELRQVDREVRAHEQAHIAAGGSFVTSGASYSYQVGPDGQAYAVGGEVGIDVSPVADDPEATIQKAQQVQAAAMAPADPSTQDMKVAAAAAQMAQDARAEAREKQQAEQFGEGRQTPNAASSKITPNASVAGAYRAQANATTAASVSAPGRFSAIA